MKKNRYKYQIDPNRHVIIYVDGISFNKEVDNFLRNSNYNENIYLIEKDGAAYKIIFDTLDKPVEKFRKELEEFLDENGYRDSYYFGYTNVTNEDAVADAGVAGMGNVVASQPSAIPGDVSGSTIGSGDIATGVAIYHYDPAQLRNPKKIKKKKKNKKDVNKSSEMVVSFDEFVKMTEDKELDIIKREVNELLDDIETDIRNINKKNEL